MTNKQIIHRFRKDYGLSGARWERFCRRYRSRDVSTVVSFIKRQYDVVPAAFREEFVKEMQRGCGQAR